MKLYLAGPMSGLPLFNFPAFAAAAESLRALGHEVFNPAEADVKLDGFDPAAHDCNKPPHTLAHYMKRDLPAVCEAEAVTVLPGWRASRGAKIEVSVAICLGLPIIDVADLIARGKA